MNKVDSLKDALIEALQSRKLAVKIEPGEGVEIETELPAVEEEQEDSSQGDEEAVLKSMMGGDDEEKALQEMEGRKPKSLGERAKLEGAKRMQAMKSKKEE